MIRLTRLNHAPIVLNSDLIEHLEMLPDTVVTLTNGQVLRVLENAEDVIARVIEFRRRIRELPRPTEVNSGIANEARPAETIE